MNKLDWVKLFKKSTTVDKFEKIIELSKGKTVLDVGCVGQDKSFDNDLWLHSRIKKVASSLIGSDIDESGIQELNSRGYEVHTPENINSMASVKKFDLIVMGDVIEHVSNPTEFIDFYADFLSEDGQILICTPNVFGIRYFLQVLYYGSSGTNPEHTFGFEPYTMLELFSRTKVTPVSFYWLKEYTAPKNLQQKIIRWQSSIVIFLRKYCSPNFMFVVKKG